MTAAKLKVALLSRSICSTWRRMPNGCRLRVADLTYGQFAQKQYCSDLFSRMHKKVHRVVHMFFQWLEETMVRVSTKRMHSTLAHARNTRIYCTPESYSYKFGLNLLTN